MLLKKGMIGPTVAKLVDDLIEAGFSPMSGRGNNFNAAVDRAVRAFQSQGIGSDGQPLVVDGVVGPLTRWALDVTLGRKTTSDSAIPTFDLADQLPPGASSTGWNAVQIAYRELANGRGEQGQNNAGSDVMRYHEVTGGKAGWSWCASFVSYCFQQGNLGSMPFEPTYGARDLLTKFKKNGWDFNANLDSPPAAGDVVVWWRHSLDDWRGHVGLVVDYSDGIVRTIEGNRGPYPSKVNTFTYVLGRIDKLLGFGRAVP